jgi:chromate transporter
LAHIFLNFALMKNKSNLLEVLQVFFKLGCLAFGGPAAHISMMEMEVVAKRKWMTSEEFLDMVGATNLIPGPNSTEMTMHCGYKRAGFAGLITAGAAFIFPASIITGVLAYFYFQYGELPEVKPFIQGIQPAILAIIASAVLKLGKKAMKNTELIILALLVLGASLYGVNEIACLLIGGIVGAIYFFSKEKNKENISKNWLLLAIPSTGVVAAKTLGTLGIFWSFLKVGAVLYGGGFVLFAYLDAELVETGFISRTLLLDAIAAGQFTPGPILSTSTFIGYQLGEFWGAIAATAGIFLPSFAFVFLLHPLIPKMRSSKFLSGFLNSVNAAALAIMAAVLINLTSASVQSIPALLIALSSAIIVFRFKKVHVLWIILGSAVAGYLLL